MSGNFTLEKGRYGPRAVLRSAWQSGTEKILQKDGIEELELNDAKGWRGNDIAFVQSLPWLKAFTIIDLKISDVEPVHCLHDLRKLEVITYCKTKIDSSSFPLLEDCGIEWRAGASSIFDCTTLRSFYVNRYSGKDTEDFSKLIHLKDLTILNSQIKCLKGLEKLLQLQVLRLGNLKQLGSLAGISKLKNLEELEIQKCNKVSSIFEIGRLPKLRKIFLNDMGAIDSIEPLAKIDTLEHVTFYESTNILDGNLSCLTRLKRLSKISFQNRRHYSHRREDFGSAYNE
ncbi:MAG: hypothetical protein M0036_11040 [Desulfobacteraceae bacterium]|nr:hypothetical protein [Desulfobacteraceae bacterium]